MFAGGERGAGTKPLLSHSGGNGTVSHCLTVTWVREQERYILGKTNAAQVQGVTRHMLLMYFTLFTHHIKICRISEKDFLFSFLPQVTHAPVLGLAFFLPLELSSGRYLRFGILGCQQPARTVAAAAA